MFLLNKSLEELSLVLLKTKKGKVRKPGVLKKATDKYSSQ